MKYYYILIQLCIYLSLYGYQLDGSEVHYRIDAETLSIDAAMDGQWIKICEGESRHHVEIREVGEKLLSFSVPQKNLSFEARIEDNELRIKLESNKPGQLTWPVYQADAEASFIFLKGDGRSVPLSDSIWLDYIQGERALYETPMWGFSNDDYSIAWICETPFRSTQRVDGRKFSIQQNFLNRFGSESHAFRLKIRKGRDPLLAAHIYRKFLQESGHFLSAREKLRDLPEDTEEKLLGAAHFYLWGYGRFAPDDIYPQQWNAFARRLSEDNQLNHRLRAHFTQEEEKALEELVQTEWPYAYLKNTLFRGLNRRMDLDLAAAFAQDYHSFFKAGRNWGGGVSPAMIEELQKAGIAKARICTSGLPESSTIPETAKAAERAGYLFGIYDSYHSIHPPALSEGEQSWPTAQFSEELYRTAGIQKSDGSYLPGFKGLGRLLNPQAVWPSFCQRVSSNLEKAELSYYFIDCDGAGGIYEDYNPRHPMSSETAVEEKRKRLAWLRREKQLVTGTEGGNPMIIPEVLVAEGPFAPVFYWEDKAFRDRKSPSFWGRFWPPEAPEINFSPISLPQSFETLYYDPSSSIPLLEALFHDSVLLTCHWNSDMLKMQEHWKTLTLLQMLYLNPPLYNLNRDRFAAEKERILRNIRFFSPIHAKFGFQRLTGFSHISEDGMVQETRFSGGLHMVANFSQHNIVYHGRRMAPQSILALLPNGETRRFTP